jgi:hypothetical protein
MVEKKLKEYSRQVNTKTSKVHQLADIDAFRTYWMTSEEQFYFPNYK